MGCDAQLAGTQIDMEKYLIKMPGKKLCGGIVLGEMFGGNVRISMQDYKSLCIAFMIRGTLVYTHRHNSDS